MSTLAATEVRTGGMTKDERFVILASSLGTVFEWYDFYLYGSLASIIGAQFFSAYPPATRDIFALLAFGGAGPLHAAALALDESRLPRMVPVPVQVMVAAGVTSFAGASELIRHLASTDQPHALLAWIDDGNRRPFTPSPPGPPDPMDIAFRRHRQIIVHHMRHGRDIQPPRRHVGGDEDVDLADLMRGAIEISISHAPVAHFPRSIS